MRRFRHFSLLVCVVPYLHNTPQISAQAADSTPGVALLRQTVQRLGGTPPSDAVIVGDVVLTAGSTHEVGTIRIAAKGLTHTAETYDTKTLAHQVVFADGIAAERGLSTLRETSFERSISARTPLAILPFLAAKLELKDLQIEDLGADSERGSMVHHLRLHSDWTKDKNLAPYQAFTMCDIWLDEKTSLPTAISYQQRQSLGAVPWTRIRIEYEDYRNADNTLQPYHMRRFVNGTLWADINITSVTLNKGVSSTEFATK